MQPQLLVSDQGQSALNTHLYFSLTTQASFLQAQKGAFEVLRLVPGKEPGHIMHLLSA